MNEVEYEAFKEFAQKLKYEIMTEDDYELVINRVCGQGVIKQKKSDTWILMTSCHNLDYHDGSPKLYFYLETRSFYCYTKCGHSMDIYSLIQKRHELNGDKVKMFQCVKEVCEILNIPFNFKDEIKKSKTDKYNWQGKLMKFLKLKHGEIELPTYDKSILDSFEPIYHQSWLDDNITIDSMDKYCIKYYRRNDSIVIPCFDANGNLIGIRQRFLNPKTDCKYLPLEILNGKSYKFPVNTTLYGLNYNTENIKYYKKVMLVEAEKSVLQTDNYFACKNFTLAMYGKSMSQQKAMEILKMGVDEIVICLDADYDNVYEDDGYTFTKEFESFYKNVHRIGEYFKGHCKVTAIIIYDKHPRNCSPTDLGKERYLELYNEREEID